MHHGDAPIPPPYPEATKAQIKAIRKKCEARRKAGEENVHTDEELEKEAGRAQSTLLIT